MTNGKRQSMLLVEIVIAVLFFALSATVILDMYAAAYAKSALAGAQSAATTDAQNLAEQLKTAEDWPSLLTGAGFDAADGAYTLERDGYRLAVTANEENAGAGTLRTAEICALRGEASLLTLRAVRYEPSPERGTP